MFFWHDKILLLKDFLKEEFEPQPKAEGPFSLRKLSSLPTFEARALYVDDFLGRGYVGMGSSRVVYKIGNNKVLKLARNESGIGQNEAESSVCSADPKRQFFTKLFAKDPKHTWIISEYAASISPETFKQLSNISWNEFTTALMGAFHDTDKVKTKDPKFLEAYNKNKNHPFFAKIMDLITQCHYEPGDFAVLQHWGRTKDNRLVILDSGFTEAVYKAHYLGFQQTQPGQQAEKHLPFAQTRMATSSAKTKR